MQKKEMLVQLLRIHSVVGLGNRTLLKYARKYSITDFIQRVHYYVAAKNSNLSYGLTAKEAEETLAFLESHGISLFTLHDDEYPELLKSIFDPPYFLYVKGDRKLLSKPCVSIVGTRKVSQYGQRVTGQIVSDLVASGVNTVSGMALGIDSMVHASTISNNGFTIAVLGSGVNVIRPMQQESLYHQIIENGCVISEFMPHIDSSKFTFVRRNRIIAGLSSVTVVVEAGVKSGSLITADFALQEGREVCAVPGNIDNQNAKGTNMLIKNGAHMITASRDVLHVLDSSRQWNVSTNEILTDLCETPLELKIVDLLSIESLAVEMLSEKLKIDFIEITTAISSLELKGVVKRNGEIISLM